MVEDLNQILTRRTLFKAAGLATAGLVVATLLPACNGLEVELEDGGRRLRGTADGLILESRDGGQSWQCATAFGSDFSVQRLSKHAEQVYARLDFHGLPVHLKSADGVVWYTSEWEPPQG